MMTLEFKCDICKNTTDDEGTHQVMVLIDFEKLVMYDICHKCFKKTCKK